MPEGEEGEPQARVADPVAQAPHQRAAVTVDRVVPAAPVVDRDDQRSAGARRRAPARRKEARASGVTMITPFEITRSASVASQRQLGVVAVHDGIGVVAARGAQRLEREVDADHAALADGAHHVRDAAGAAADVENRGVGPGQRAGSRRPSRGSRASRRRSRADRSGRGSGRSARGSRARRCTRASPPRSSSARRLRPAFETR